MDRGFPAMIDRGVAIIDTCMACNLGVVCNCEDFPSNPSGLRNVLITFVQLVCGDGFQHA